MSRSLWAEASALAETGDAPVPAEVGQKHARVLKRALEIGVFGLKVALCGQGLRLRSDIDGG